MVPCNQPQGALKLGTPIIGGSVFLGSTRFRFCLFSFLLGPGGYAKTKTTMLEGSKKTRPRLARKQNIASEVGPTLQDAFFFPTLREASARQHQARCKLVGASWSAQVALRKLHCASCSAQVAPRKLLQVGPCKWLPASCSVQIALPASCSVQAALCKLLCASCSA